MTKPDERYLLSQLRAGRPEACAELIRAHHQSVYRFLVHLTRDVHRAEDLTQETFAAAWEKIAAFQGRATLATWLHRIAYTKFVDAQRAERRNAGMLGRLNRPEIAPSDPLDSAIANDEARHLYRCCTGSTVPDRAVLVLHYLQGLSYGEMAAVLDEPVGTVKWRTSEALNRLRALFCDKVPDHVPGKISGSGPIA